jgi:fumarylacetoacetase
VRNAGRIVTNNELLPPAYKHFPIAYHGRASSIYVSGTKIERPVGYARHKNKLVDGQPAIEFGPSESVDYEMEFAAIIGRPIEAGTRLKASDAEGHIFGFVVLNDWSGMYYVRWLQRSRD